MHKKKYTLSENVNFVFVDSKVFFTQTQKNIFMHSQDLIQFLARLGRSFNSDCVQSLMNLSEEESLNVINELVEYGVVVEEGFDLKHKNEKNLYDTLRILQFRKRNTFLDYENSDLAISKKSELVKEYEKDLEGKFYEALGNTENVLPIPGYIHPSRIISKLSSLLYFTNGTILNAKAYSKYNVSLKPTPSNGTCHPVLIFVLLPNVNGLNGLYRYVSNNHSLIKYPQKIKRMSKNKIRIFIGIEFEQEQWRYRHSFNYIDTLIDLGHVCGQLNIVADNIDICLQEESINENIELLKLESDFKISILKYYTYNV